MKRGDEILDGFQKDGPRSEPTSILLNTIQLTEDIIEQAKKTSSLSHKMLEEIKHRPKNEGNQSMTTTPDHDPGKRGPITSDAQRNHLIGLGPHQPKLMSFPKTDHPTKNQAECFESKWYDSYPHLEYSIAKDSAFCFVCSLFSTSPSEWSTTGVRSWHKFKSRGKSKKTKLQEHFNSTAHQTAAKAYTSFVSPVSGHVNALLDKEVVRSHINREYQESYNQKIANIFLDITKTIGRQGLA